MYVGTIVEYDDQSAISTLPIADVRTQPLYLALFTSDKGPEEWTELSGKDWFKMYGENISFARHGQPLLQSAISINAGARLLSKRLVADDAKLANLSIVATVTDEEVQATNAAGKPLYLQDGIETTEVTETPKMIHVAKIKYEGVTATDVNEVDPKFAFDSAAEKSVGEHKYLLFTITDNGRGISSKRFMITPNYRLSKAKNFIEYVFDVTENNKNLESMTFTPIPHLVVNGKNHSLQNVVESNSDQIKCVQNDAGITGLINEISTVIKQNDPAKDVAYVEGVDFLFGCTNKGVAMQDIVVDDSGLNLQDAFGQALLSGNNGIFANDPINHEDEYVKQVEYALGTDSTNVYDTLIFDLDRYKIDMIIDANYPEKVKRAIETLVTYREDCVFLRDYGTDIKNLEMIKIHKEELLVNNKFIADYCSSYDVIDPYSKKQITVTAGYSLAKLMVHHLNAGRILPACGIKHDMIIDEAIDGTLNFAPVVCPEPLGNQKEVMEELHVNYATYIGRDLVIETEYTSQDANTQFSYLNNILGIQEVVRAIRTRCPVIRYSFIDGEDLERYKADIEDVISQYSSNFKSIKFEYVADPVYVNNKIFYAAINVGFRDFIQTEWFKVTAINVSES